MRWFANDFHSWLRHSWKLLANHLTRDQKIVIHGNSCIILYLHDTYSTFLTPRFQNESQGMQANEFPIKSTTGRIALVATAETNIAPSHILSLLSATDRRFHLPAPDPQKSPRDLGPVSTSNETSYCNISQSLEAARFVLRIARSLWNLTGTSAALLPMCLLNFKAMW